MTDDNDNLNGNEPAENNQLVSVPESLQTDKKIPTLIDGEMKKSYVTYAMSVIVSRALPDVRDGLKPVHRRVLYGMLDLGLSPGKPYKKSARIVGDVIGKYHPHGDSAVYQTLVRMAQDFSMRYPLVDGQGNFGSVDGDSAAAMRYTEARMRDFSELMLEDLDKETVDFSPNYDESLKEPRVLPSAIPNLLVNGSTGIAVGMATSMPPHNLREIVRAVRAIIANPQLPDDELLGMVSGPDFPTGGIIYGRLGIHSAYLHGRGRVLVRSKTEIETNSRGRDAIIVTEIPYQVSKAALIEKIASLVKAKEIEGIADIRDESDREGMRIIFELKREAFPDIVLNQLFKYTQLQTTFSIINLALVDGKPKVLSLRELINEYIRHRHEIVVRRTQFDLTKAEDRANILEGLRIAIHNLDEVIRTIRESKNTESARRSLEERFGLNEKQSHAIVEMRLRMLTGLEIEKIEAEYNELLIKIADLKDLLANQSRRMQLISDELGAIVEKHGDARRTEIVDASDEVTHLDLIPNEPMVVTVSHRGYAKRMSTEVYRAQGRGGKGVQGASFIEEDFVEHLFIALAHSTILVFTDLGRCYWLKVYELPEAARAAKGKALINLIALQPDEKVKAFVPINDFKDPRSLVFATEQGLINKMSLEDFSRPRQGGIHACNLMEGDHLVSVLLASEDQDVMIGSRKGQAIRFEMAGFRQCGRGTRGVKGISLDAGDQVIGMVVLSNKYTILTLTEKGYGKRTPPDEYRLTARAGKGVRNIRITDKNGEAVAIAAVEDSDELMVLTKGGIIIRTPVNQISVLGRDTQGVRVIRVADNDTVADVALTQSEPNLDAPLSITEKSDLAEGRLYTSEELESKPLSLDDDEDGVETNSTSNENELPNSSLPPADTNSELSSDEEP